MFTKNDKKAIHSCIKGLDAVNKPLQVGIINRSAQDLIDDIECTIDKLPLFSGTVHHGVQLDSCLVDSL